MLFLDRAPLGIDNFVFYFMAPKTWPKGGACCRNLPLLVPIFCTNFHSLWLGSYLYTRWQKVNCYDFHRAAEEDVEAQRQELMAGFDDAQRKREHEFRKKADDLSNSLLASDLKVRVIVFVLPVVCSLSPSSGMVFISYY